MKKRLALVLFAGAAALTAVCAAARQNQTPPANATHAAKKPGKTIFAGYLKWRRVNPKPVMMDAQAAAMCAPAAPSKQFMDSPHFGKRITVYVNKTGQDAMLRQRKPHFPVGTVIVKEKRNAPDDQTPELMTIMTKKSAGYDTAHGDWEYAVTAADGKIQTQGKMAKCQHCHEQKKSVDYVFKGYVP